MTQHSRNPNRLISEKSPYLLQHAYNPVDWYPWGDEAFERAQRDDKPIFVSVGYSTCFWCHVMEREVFENEEIAQLMNEALVSIKVDREERPDIDRIYMSAVQGMTGSGGWPMSVFLTHDRKPFFGGTYFPPRPHPGRPSFPDIVRRISELWKTDRDRLLRSAQEITEFLVSAESHGPPLAMTADMADGSFRIYHSAFDRLNGGFGGAPKFPRPALLEFLLRYHVRTGNPQVLEMVGETLHHMAEGGVHDHIGGGFHRYSVDGEWHVPHFEKMLYDQAQLVITYIEFFQISHDTFFADVARDTLGYISTNLSDPAGGFYSAEDAESAIDPSELTKKEEGAFYVWTAAELERLLGRQKAAMFSLRYDVQPNGNVAHDPMNAFAGKNVLRIVRGIEEVARASGVEMPAVAQALADARAVLRTARDARPRPALDDKIITAWNGLAISAFSRAAAALEEPRYLRRAGQAAQFLLDHLCPHGVLRRRYRQGEARFDASLQDYAFLVQGLIDLYEASFKTDWLQHAANLTTEMIRLFRDPATGVLFDSSGLDASLIIRSRETYDGAEPSGSSVAALNLLRLGTFFQREEWIALAKEILASFGSQIRRLPDSLPAMLCAGEWLLGTPQEIVLAGEADSEPLHALRRVVNSRFLPNKILLLSDTHGSRFFADSLPAVEGMKELNGVPAAYVCKNFACQLPTSDPEALAALL